MENKYKYIVQGISIICATIVLSMLAYAMSVPSIPNPSKAIAEIIKDCISDQDRNHKDPLTPDQFSSIAKTCSENLRDK